MASSAETAARALAPKPTISSASAITWTRFINFPPKHRHRHPRAGDLDLDHHPSLHLALEDARSQLRQVLQPDCGGHAVEQLQRQVPDDARPSLQPLRHRCHYRIDAE